MALVKIFTEEKDHETIAKVARIIKIICAAALNSREIPTGLNTVETVVGEGIDLIGIDYILEVVACERGNEDEIAREIVRGLNTIFPDKYFSVYFNLIGEKGMANTPRPKEDDIYLTMDEAIELSRKEIK